MNNKVVVRVPPSPTGRLHIGTARTMLFNYLFAKQNNGNILFRSEDTDRSRSKIEYEKDIIDGLAWLGLTFDNTDNVYRQSEHSDTYKKYIEKLIESGHAYLSKEEPNDENKRGEVIRFKNPNRVVSFDDVIRGEISFDTTELGDFVIAKSLDEALYHLAVVVDDIETEVTHIIRGEDHISNTPRHILIQEALGVQRPIYAHIPLILMPDKSKMSKRKHGEAVSVAYYKDRGYLPEALTNFLALLGWNPGTEQEIFSLDELIKTFDLTKVQKAGAIFNVEKLNWFNKVYSNALTISGFRDTVSAFLPKSISEEKIQHLIPDLRERINVPYDLVEMEKNGEFDFYSKTPSPSDDLIVSNTKVSIVEIRDFMAVVSEKLKNVSEFTKENIKQEIWDFATEKGRGNVLWPMRVILTGKEKSPDPFTVAEILGKEETIKRLANVN